MLGIDEDDKPVHGSMYQDLWMNGPMCLQEFPDYTAMDHFKKPTPSYCSREVYLDYLRGKKNHFN